MKLKTLLCALTMGLASLSLMADKKVKAGNGPITLQITNTLEDNLFLTSTKNYLNDIFNEQPEEAMQKKVIAVIPAGQSVIVEGLALLQVYPDIERFRTSEAFTLVNSKKEDLYPIGVFYLHRKQNEEKLSFDLGTPDEGAVEVTASQISQYHFIVNITAKKTVVLDYDFSAVINP